MPKVGMEPVRKKALISAVVAEIGEAGTLDVTVSQIAKRAGMSPALAHHYFGSKEQMFLAAIRQVLTAYGDQVRANLKEAGTPEERVHAIVQASFDKSQFKPEIVAAWLAFYVRSMHVPAVRRLLQVYARRLQSNLTYNLRQMFDDVTARKIAQGLASMIDGFYIRQALQDATPDREAARDLVNDYLHLWMERKQNA